MPCIKALGFGLMSLYNDSTFDGCRPIEQEGVTLQGEMKRVSKHAAAAKVIETWITSDGKMLPSTKIVAIKAQILERLQKDRAG